MNNLKNLYPCLNSIREHTVGVSYEALVVAYLFNHDNLERVRKDFPWATFIVSDEIRGFSENNNLALRQAKGKYCFVLNDDTEIRTDVVSRLTETLESLPEEAAIVSPVTTFPDGRVQVCGRPKFTWKTFVLDSLHLPHRSRSGFVNGKGVFQTYNILGAAFLIKTEVFRSAGWFDERYFFAPEDIALSTLLNKRGYECYVDADVSLIHYEGMTGKSLSMVRTATAPAGVRGSLLFYAGGSSLGLFGLQCFKFLTACLQYVFHGVKALMSPRPNEDYVLWVCDIHVLATCFSSKTPKEIFTKYFTRLKR